MPEPRIRYAAIKDGKMYEGTAKELAAKINVCADALTRKTRDNDGIATIKGITVFRAFDDVAQILDNETGFVIAEGKAEGVSVQLGYNRNWASHIIKNPSKAYSGRRVWKPTEHYLQNAGKYEHDV